MHFLCRYRAWKSLASKFLAHAIIKISGRTHRNCRPSKCTLAAQAKRILSAASLIFLSSILSPFDEPEVHRSRYDQQRFTWDTMRTRNAFLILSPFAMDLRRNELFSSELRIFSRSYYVITRVYSSRRKKNWTLYLKWE
jgi:hypothetical protein